MMFLHYPGGLARALTFSYDDGVEQDERLIRLLNEHGMKGTFNLNSGLFSSEGSVFAPGTVHRRMTLAHAREVYMASGHEVAVHCFTHASLPELSQPQMVQEIMMDRETLEGIFGGIVRGMAYPFGAFDDSVVEVLRMCGILYARTVISSHGFALPRDWLRMAATCHHDDPMLMELADRFLSSKTCFESKLFYLWGHAYEFEANDNWQVIESFLDKLAGRKDIWYATNIEICSYTLAWKQVYTSVDGHLMHNPTDRAFWFELDNKPMLIHPGETLAL